MLRPTPTPKTLIVGPAGEGGTNAATIGGGVAGAVKVIVTIAFFVVRGRQLRRDPHAGIKYSQETLRHDRDAILPSIENTRKDAVALSSYHRASITFYPTQRLCP